MQPASPLDSSLRQARQGNAPGETLNMPKVPGGRWLGRRLFTVQDVYLGKFNSRVHYHACVQRSTPLAFGHAH